ncbi:glutamine--fructose-6-phosphate transaminase (isomerizing) [Candidatus Daviesbacteria bacterium]|nr:glutamine--fructose-6-phosphate transaminase (isomerizing) [Candidatus Daviesbacteria bacterium]
MCGIFGYSGSKNASQLILEGLKRLEYRGYDSWGIALQDQKSKIKDQKLIAEKHVGAIGDVNSDFRLSSVDSYVGIGHTRWATHGGISETNAHPHFSTDKSFCLAQNGIAENYQKLKKDLQKKGYKFKSETDTEVIVRLIEDKLASRVDSGVVRGFVGTPQNDKSNSLKEAVRSAFLELEGRNTVIVLTDDGQIIAARNGSPLVVGLGKREVFFSSDTLSFAPFVSDVIVVENGQMVTWNGKLDLLDIKSNKSLPANPEKINFKSSKVDKEGYDHFMLKEIHESPYVISQVINQDQSSLDDFVKVLKKAQRVYTLSMGTAGVAASQIAFYLRNYAQINAVGLIAAEALDYYEMFSNQDMIITPSQSGETADVLEVLEVAVKKNVKIASFVNMPGSTMTRVSDYKFMANAGPEICVMSTKVFTSQIAFGYLIAKMAQGKGEEGVRNLQSLALEMQKYLDSGSNHEQIKQLAKELSKKKDVFLLGKYQNFNIVKEGMIKMIEGSYIHAHGIPAGDLKHYAITLMEKGVPVIVVISEDIAKDDVLNAVNQVKARGATVIGVSPSPYPGFDYHIPVPDTGETSAIANIIPLQLLAYYMAVELGHNVDKPRNIAKSVTVK